MGAWQKISVFQFDSAGWRIHFLLHGFHIIPLAADCAADLLECFKTFALAFGGICHSMDKTFNSLL